MNTESHLFKHLDKLGQQSIVELDDLWGRRIVPLDCESLFLLDEDIKRNVDQIGEKQSKPRQNSLTRIGATSYDLMSLDTVLENTISSMLLEFEIEEKRTSPKCEAWCEKVDHEGKHTEGSGGFRGSRRKRKQMKSSRILPLDFQPLPYSVIVGKGKESKNVVGNERLRVLASRYLKQYAAASEDKHEKSEIVSKVIATVRTACPVGAFIKLGKDDGRWYEVSHTAMREKVGYTFRDLLGDKYRSSSKAKAAMRSLQKSLLSSDD